MKRRSPRIRTNLRNPAHCANRHYPACGNLAEQRPATPNLAFFVPPVQRARARALEIYRVNDERLYPREMEKRDEENGKAKAAGDPPLDQLARSRRGACAFQSSGAIKGREERLSLIAFLSSLAR